MDEWVQPKPGVAEAIGLQGGALALYKPGITRRGHR